MGEVNGRKIAAAPGAVTLKLEKAFGEYVRAYLEARSAAFGEEVTVAFPGRSKRHRMPGWLCNDLGAQQKHAPTVHAAEHRLMDHQAGDAQGDSGYGQDDAEEPEDFFAR